MVELVVKQLTKSYGSQEARAVDNVDFTLSSGRWLTLLGPSGCGKTTTLNCIAGLDTPTSGIIKLGGKPLFEEGKSVPPEQRDIGMVFQSYALWPHMTVSRNIGFPLRFRGGSKRAKAERIAHFANLVELEDLLDRYPHELSGGQQQRVALARALVYEPTILLLDEPLSNLDVKLRERARAWLTKLQRQLGTTTVYVTHDQIEAFTMSDEIAVMNNGMIVQLGTPEQICKTPINPYVADFVGASNFIEGRVQSKNGEYGRIRIGNLEMDFFLPPDIEPLDQVVVAARPSSIRLAEAVEAGALKARITQRAYLGYRYEYFAEIDGGKIRFESLKRIAENVKDVGLVLNLEECNVYRKH